MIGKATSLAAFCLFAFSGAASPQDLGGGAADSGGRASLRWYLADLKTSFPEHQMYSPATALTDANYVAVLGGLKDKAKVNGIRLPIFPGERDAGHYSGLYKNVASYARRLGLAIYASPMSVGMKDYQGWSDRQYADWLANYISTFHPDFLSPFNEPGIGDDRNRRDRRGAAVPDRRPNRSARPRPATRRRHARRPRPQSRGGTKF